MLKQSVGMGQQIQLDGVRVYPAASVSNYPASCSMRSIPRGKDSDISPTFNQNNWVWTYTPTLVRS